MLFEEIMESHKEKKFISLCKKLIKKCSFTSGADATNLCELAYWLYVVGDSENALKVCEFTNIDIPAKINYNVWDFILFIWGLEEQMKKVWSTPKNSNDTEEKAWAFMQKILSRQTFESVCDINEIEENEAAGDKKSADSYRFIALYSMISYGITGFCPDLVDKGEKLNEKIREYIGCLK